MRGSGTEEDPYQITTVEELQAVNQDLFAHYVLEDDIDAEKTTKRKRGFNPIGDTHERFRGSFEGNNNQIKNLHIEEPKKDDVGLFANNGGQIKNLIVTDATVSGSDYVGGLVGLNNGRVASVSTLVDASGNKNVGGLVGSNVGCIVSSHSISHISGTKFVGGLVGRNEAKLTSSYAKGDVSGHRIVGGLVGQNLGSVDSSYSRGFLLGNKVVGRLVGSNRLGTVESSYAIKTGEVDDLTDVRNNLSGLDSSFVFSSSDKDNIPKDCDLVISRDNCEILYSMDTNMLYLLLENENKYSRSGVSPPEAHKLAQGLDSDIEEISDELKSSIVAI